MRRTMHFLATILFMMMLLISIGFGPVSVEGRTCESQSHKFKGACVSDTNCGSVCKTEGFPSGNCRGFRHRCFCVKHC
ncbi:antimicrobial response protein [Lithospermum erythrorhizon]|uniref:Antimicrobial response protein n=1 Tax=Lithospermum erythrorhizon TaxID=34254 RepID=A0AAV3NM61_LITER